MKAISFVAVTVLLIFVSEITKLSQSSDLVHVQEVVNGEQGFTIFVVIAVSLDTETDTELVTEAFFTQEAFRRAS